MKRLRVGLSQINSSVGDVAGNAKKAVESVERARAMDVDILCFPELAVTGYPPEDLLLKTEFIDDNIRALDEIRKRCADMVVIAGFVDKKDDIFNSAAVIQNGEIADVYHKLRLPNYGVFDENRYFQSGRRFPVYRMEKMTFGVTICEDIWYPGDPMRSQVLLGNAQLIFNLSASPYYMGKPLARERMLATRAVDYNSIIAYCNAVGGQDELVFDGNSMVISEKGEITACAKKFRGGPAGLRPQHREGVQVEAQHPHHKKDQVRAVLLREPRRDLRPRTRKEKDPRENPAGSGPREDETRWKELSRL